MDHSMYLFDITKVNDPDEAVKTALMNICEGCVFINPPGFTTYSGKINGYRANLCSTAYLSFDDLQRIEVTLKNLKDPENNEYGIRVYVYDTRSLQAENPIFAFENGPDLLGYVKRANITVYHENGQHIEIKCESIKVSNKIGVTDVNRPMSDRRYDSRSLSSAKYVYHPDTLVDKSKLKV